MHPKMIATVVTTGKSKIRIPAPNIPTPLVEAKDRASAVQVNMASVVAIEFRQWQVLLLSLVTSFLPSGSLQP